MASITRWRPLLLLALALGVAASPLAASAQGRTVRLGHNRAWGNPALLIGLTQGHFKQAGLEVSEREFSTSADAIRAIASGDLDIGVCPSGVLFRAVQQGVKAKAVALAQGNHRPPIAYIVRADSPIKTVEDLRGKKAGIASRGGSIDLYMRAWLARGGLTLDKDLEIVSIPFYLTLQAVVNRQIDIGAVDSVAQVKAEQQYPGQTRTLFTYVDVTKAALGNDHANGLVLVFGDQFVQRDRDTAVKFLEAYLRAIRAIDADPKKAISAWADAAKSDDIRKLQSPPIVPADGKVYLDTLQWEADLAVKAGYLKQAIDVRTVVDHSLIDEAAARLR